ncbi:MAG: L,D-transpeptidase, partial [Acidobacteriota bacterium]|nr:L,D-transpeptidase [Acidobacteriota bacterium]
MKSFPRATTFTVAFSFLLLAVGCEVQPTSTVNNNATGGASPTPTQVAATTMPAATPETGGNRVPVTLPVVDALFATDEKFAGELKEKLQLTDAQIDGLRGAAREETAKLRESDDEDYGGTATAAATRAEEHMREIVGAEKSGQLTAFVRERWNSGGEGGGNGAGTAAGAAASTGKINAVPTDTRVVVNTPAYRMDLFENGTLVKSYKVGIGYPEFPLPTGTRKASTIIFNPTWTPPDEPWVESGSSKVKVGEKVDAGSALNPLGLIKIPIGSPSLIHGGKSAAKLGTFASHGCVGLTNPQVQDFALQLAKLGGAQVTEEEVKNYAKERKETKNVVLSNPVAVELRYETIVVEDGKLHIYRDVYGYG